ncbi:LuxR C-terminal-related transcriptional regulator [Paenibacillus alkalitolerans]|uniref:LuxR C-terminal-related transcriptional regulator n=1 Tax=Paenibacillus alkalitolerans TaxID=2799335 RepID=UPI002D80FB85|nr:LuxR C-terminal-related transcriptional regulator [Paenibacillus alkalitolerans]
MSYLLRAGNYAFLYRDLIGLLDEAAAAAESGGILESLVNINGYLDFAGFAIPGERNQYRIAEYSGPNRDEWMNASFSYGEGFLGQVCMLGLPRSWTHLEADPRTAFFREKGLQPRHIFGYPVVVDSQTSGVLFGGSLTKRDFDDDFESFLHILSLFIGMKLQLDALKKKKQNHTTQLAALVEISKIMNTATDLKKVLYVLVDVSLILLSQASFCHLLIQIPGSPKAQIVSRGIKKEQVQSYSKTIIDRYFTPGNKTLLTEPELTDYGDGESVLTCPIFVRSELCGILSAKLPNSAVYEQSKDIFSTFIFLSGITLERILSGSVKEELYKKAKLLHEAAKVWNRQAYDKAARIQELALEFADHLGLPPGEKEHLSAACLLCVYPDSYLREQLAGDALLSVLERYISLKGGTSSEAVMPSEYPLSSRILLLAYTYLEHNEQISPLHDLIAVEEPLRRDFIAFVMKKFTVDLEMAIGRRAAASPSDHIDFEQLKKKINISSREQDVLRLILKGLSNREIAEELFISEHTVKNHITNIFHKLEVTDRAQAMARVYNMGFQH